MKTNRPVRLSGIGLSCPLIRPARTAKKEAPRSSITAPLAPLGVRSACRSDRIKAAGRRGRKEAAAVRIENLLGETWWMPLTSAGKID
jgi:hypothetical protein